MISDNMHTETIRELSPTKNKKPTIQMYLDVDIPDPKGHPDYKVECIFVRVIYYPEGGKAQICQGKVAIAVPQLEGQVGAVAARLAMRHNEQHQANMSDDRIARDAIDCFDDLRRHLQEGHGKYVAQA